jgi:hypothetical protein
MSDSILNTFLEHQYREGLALAERSDLFELVPLDHPPYRRYIVRFFCKGLVRRGGQVVEAERFEVGIRFPDDYLRRIDAGEVIALLGPPHTFHPNILHFWICAGGLIPGTSLVDLIYSVFEILTYNKVTMIESDALNPEACVWARENRHRFPIDRRPLVRSQPEALNQGAGPGVGDPS